MTYLTFRHKGAWDREVSDEGKMTKTWVLRSYAYLSESERIDGRVRQRSLFAFPIEQWNMKELIFLLTGETPFNDEHKEKFEKESRSYCTDLDTVFSKWETMFRWSRAYIIKRYAECVPCKGCVYDYIQEHGMPKTFERIFAYHGVLDAVLKTADRWRELRSSDTDTVSLHEQEGTPP